jgi:hypothetical protein
MSRKCEESRFRPLSKDVATTELTARVNTGNADDADWQADKQWVSEWARERVSERASERVVMHVVMSRAPSQQVGVTLLRVAGPRNPETELLTKH